MLSLQKVSGFCCSRCKFSIFHCYLIKFALEHAVCFQGLHVCMFDLCGNIPGRHLAGLFAFSENTLQQKKFSGFVRMVPDDEERNVSFQVAVALYCLRPWV